MSRTIGTTGQTFLRGGTKNKKQKKNHFGYNLNNCRCFRILEIVLTLQKQKPLNKCCFNEPFFDAREVINFFTLLFSSIYGLGQLLGHFTGPFLPPPHKRDKNTALFKNYN